MKGIEFLDKLPTVCQFCNHQLMHIEKELNIVLIDDKGEPESENTIYENRLVCTFCGEEFKFSKSVWNYSLGQANIEPPGKLYKRVNSLGNNNGFGYFNKEEE